MALLQETIMPADYIAGNFKRRHRLTERIDMIMHLGEQYFDLANSNRQAGYSLYNARVGVAASTFEIMFWGRNLGDKLYIAYAYDTGATRLGDPRNWGVTVRKSF
ncbi:hypothetical protein [Dawidia cretensis]|nr:hypothetical protein [Dawidia cretensis]